MTSNSTAPALITSLEEWFTPRRFAILLALLICATFPDVIVGGKTFFHRDYAVFGYPLAFYHRECFWRGELPLWTPLSYCGLPFLAQWNTMTLYPLSLIYLVFPISWSLGLFCLSHLYLAGLGMYFLAFRWTQNRFAAAVAGLAFVFNAVLLNCLMWPNNIAGFAWMPFVVLAVERAWREGGRRIILAALVGAMQMLSGAPEVILLTWLFLGVLLLLEMWREREWRWRMPMRFAAVAGFVAGLTAAQLLPFLDLLLASQRHEGFADSTWAMPVWGWANFLVPLFRAQPTALGVYAQPAQYWIGSYYLGVGAAALALLAAWQVRQPRVRLLALCTLACLVVSLGDPGFVYGVLRRVLPGLGFMRFPIKFVILPTFLVPLLAAFFVTHCLALGGDAWPRLRRKLIGAAVILTATIGLIILAAYQFPLKNTSAATTLQSGLTRVVFLGLVLGALAAACCAREPRRQMLSAFGLVLFLWLDVLTMGPRPNPTVARWVYEPGLAARESGMSPVPRVGNSRPMLSAEAEGNVNVVQLTNAVDAVIYSRLALFANANLLDDIPKVIGSYSLYFRELNEVFGIIYGNGGGPSPGLLDFLAVSHVNAPGKITQWAFRPTHLPWVTGGQKPVFADAPTTLRGLSSSDFDPRRDVYLPLESRNEVTVGQSSSPKVITHEFTSRRVQIETDAAEPALVVVAQSFYHNWRAYVDGKPTTLLRANHAFQALKVPAGKHEVLLKYEDTMFRWGMVISGLAAAGCVLISLRRPQPAKASDA